MKIRSLPISVLCALIKCSNYLITCVFLATVVDIWMQFRGREEIWVTSLIPKYPFLWYQFSWSSWLGVQICNKSCPLTLYNLCVLTCRSLTVWILSCLPYLSNTKHQVGQYPITPATSAYFNDNSDYGGLFYWPMRC